MMFHDCYYYYCHCLSKYHCFLQCTINFFLKVIRNPALQSLQSTEISLYLQLGNISKVINPDPQYEYSPWRLISATLYNNTIVISMLNCYCREHQWSRNCLPFLSSRDYPRFYGGSCYSIFSFMCMLCISLFVLLSFFFWSLCCLFFYD